MVHVVLVRTQSVFSYSSVSTSSHTERDHTGFGKAKNSYLGPSVTNRLVSAAGVQRIMLSKKRRVSFDTFLLYSHVMHTDTRR